MNTMLSEASGPDAVEVSDDRDASATPDRNASSDANAGVDAIADADPVATDVGPGDRPDEPSVVVVEDDPDLAALFAEWLAEWYDVATAADGDEALGLIDDDTDAVLLDRRMPGTSGDEVLAALRRRGVDCRVAMVTAVAPAVDVVDLPFDDYLEKPVSASDLRATVERLLVLDTYADLQLELSSKRVRRSVLAGELSRAELADSEPVARLDEEIAALEREVAGIERELPDYEPVLERISRSPGVVSG